MESKTTIDGTELYVSSEEAERGSKGAFFVVYVTENANTQWGYFCGNCRTFDNAMDAMGRIKCNVCANIRKPNEWDAAHE